MTSLILSALASAFIVSAIDELIIDLGKWRGLLALIFASIAAYITGDGNLGVIAVTSMAAAFLSLASTVIVGALTPTQVAQVGRLPRRVPPL